MTVEEMLAVIEQFDQALSNHYTFAFFSGLRTGEVIGLRWEDYDKTTGRVLVQRSVSRGILKSTKTGKERWVELLPPALQALKAQRALLGTPKGWLFPNPFTLDRWANESKLTRRWTKALKRAQVRYRRPYHTRHTFASMMLSAGEGLLWVASQLGHADWHMVQERYAKWMPSAHGRLAGSAAAKAGHATWPKIDDLLARRDADAQRRRPLVPPPDAAGAPQDLDG